VAHPGELFSQLQQLLVYELEMAGEAGLPSDVLRRRLNVSHSGQWSQLTREVNRRCPHLLQIHPYYHPCRGQPAVYVLRHYLPRPS
jgi:hypothetical protein